MTPVGTAESIKVGPTFDQSAESDLAADALIKEARRLQRRRWAFGGFLVAVLLGVVLLQVVVSKGAAPSKHDLPAKVAAPSSSAPSRAFHSTTAYVVDAAGLVPVDLATQRVGEAIRIAGFSFSGGYSNVAIAPDGKFAYVVTSPNPPHTGHALSGPALVTINLLTRHIVGRVSFSASAAQPGQSGPAPSFYIDALAITPNGHTLLVADAADNALIPIDVATHTVAKPIALPPERPWDSLISNHAGTNYDPSSPAPITDLTVNPDGRTAYLVDGYAVVPVDLADGRAERPIVGFDGPEQMAISPNGKTAYVTNPYCWEVISSGLCEKPPAHPISEPNGHIQLAAVGDHVSVLNLADGRIVRSINVGKGADPTGVALSSTGSTIYLTFGRYGTRGEEVAELNTSTGQTTARIPTGAGPNAGSDLIAVTSDGNEAFVSGFNVVTPGPEGPVVFRGVIPIDLRTRSADRPHQFWSTSGIRAVHGFRPIRRMKNVSTQGGASVASRDQNAT